MTHVTGNKKSSSTRGRLHLVEIGRRSGKEVPAETMKDGLPEGL
jgi:hypothetical protein